MSQASAPFAPARRLALGLMLLLAVWAGWSGWALVQGVVQVAQVRLQWVTYPAVVTNRSSRAWVELEVAQDLLPQLGPVNQPAHAVPSDPTLARIEVPRLPLQDPPLFAHVLLAQHPEQPQRLQVIDWQGDLWPQLACALQVALALFCLVWLRRMRWGQDLCWSAGQWVNSADLAAAPGQVEGAADVLREEPGARRWVTFWAVFFGLLALGLAGLALSARGTGLAEAMLGLLPAGALSLLAARSALTVHTRRIAFDDRGISDGHFFGVRRVPWAAIARFKEVDLNEDERRRHQRSGSGDDAGSTPEALPVWELRDAQGQPLLTLPQRLSSGQGYTALRRRIRAAIAGAARPA